MVLITPSSPKAEKKKKLQPNLVANFEVLTLLGAARLFLVQAFIDETVQLIRAIATVIVVVTKQTVGDALLVVAEIKGIIALAL